MRTKLAYRVSANAAPSAGKAAGHQEAAVLLILGSCTSLQLGAALARRLFPVTGAPGATLLRLAIAAVALVAISRPRVFRWRWAQWRAALLYGASLAGLNGFYYAALARLPLSAAATIQFLGPLTLAAALSRRGRDAGWAALALLGVLTLGLTADNGGGTGGALDPAGVGLALVSAAFWALYIVAGSGASLAVPGRGGLAVAMTTGALILLPFGARGAWHAAGRPHSMLLALGVAMLASVVPYTLELAALRRAPRRVFGILLSLNPALATLAGWLLLGQHTVPLAIAAVATVIIASIGSTLTARQPAAPSGEAVRKRVMRPPAACGDGRSSPEATMRMAGQQLAGARVLAQEPAGAGPQDPGDVLAGLEGGACRDQG
jgi:inner membrane transporter RhtA